MEQQTELPTGLITVSLGPKKANSPNSRLAQYKARPNVPDQQARRRRLLEEQKQKRGELFNVGRGLVEELSALHEEHDMEWTAVQAKPRQRRIYKDRLMLSEWLVHVPDDLLELWYLMPCPKGRRNLVVATGGKTRAYSKNGQRLATFQSILPGGHRNEFKACTVLDCIWSFTNHTYYILDVLAWNNQPLLDCEAEFRFCWLKSKMEEMSCLSERSNDNAFIFTSLPYHQCSVSTMTNIMASENLFGQDGPALDGLLFYHSEAHYVPGRTPLVGWLKPHMMATVLSIPVASVYLQAEKEKKHRKFHKHQSKSQDETPTEMETNVSDETGDSYSEMHVEEMETKDSSPNNGE